jgi:hypothetical protein
LGSYELTFPDPTGADCLLIFCGRSLDGWLSTGRAMPPVDSRFHSLTDAFALPIGLPQPRRRKHYDSEHVCLGKKDSTSRDFVALATKTDQAISDLKNKLNHLIGLYNAHVHATLSTPPTPSETPLAALASTASTIVKIGE